MRFRIGFSLCLLMGILPVASFSAPSGPSSRMSSATSSATSSGAKASAPEIKFIATSVPSLSPLEGLLTGSKVPFQGPLRNMKISIVFRRPLSISQVSLKSCSGEWADGIQVFTSPALGRTFIEGGTASFTSKIDEHTKTQSIAIVFGQTAELCLQNLSFLDEKSRPLAVTFANVASAKSSSANAEILFDAHPETPSRLDQPVELSFDKVQKFDRALVWTGGSPRSASTLKFIGEHGWSETFPLRNTSTEQNLVFKTSYSGQKMSIIAPDSGELGEVRFALGSKVQSVQLGLSVNTGITKKFEDSGFDRVLDIRWVPTSAEVDKWLVIFRQDGTYFVRGFGDDQHQARAYSSLGAFTVERSEKGKLYLRLNGVRFTTGNAWDGVSCPFACGSSGALDDAVMVTDTLMLDQTDDGSMIIRNRSPKESRTITIDDLAVHRATED